MRPAKIRVPILPHFRGGFDGACLIRESDWRPYGRSASILPSHGGCRLSKIQPADLLFAGKVFNDVFRLAMNTQAVELAPRHTRSTVIKNRNILVLSGEGPAFRKADYFRKSLLDRDRLVTTDISDDSMQPDTFSIFDLVVGPAREPLLRPKSGYLPHLTSFSLDSILDKLSWEYQMLDLAAIWEGDQEPKGIPGVVFLSTTFICNQRTIERVCRSLRSDGLSCCARNCHRRRGGARSRVYAQSRLRI